MTQILRCGPWLLRRGDCKLGPVSHPTCIAAWIVSEKGAGFARTPELVFKGSACCRTPSFRLRQLWSLPMSDEPCVLCSLRSFGGWVLLFAYCDWSSACGEGGCSVDLLFNGLSTTKATTARATIAKSIHIDFLVIGLPPPIRPL